MGNLRAVMSAALLSFAACSGDGAAKPDAPLIHLDAAIDAIPDSPPPPDAPSYDFTCLNNTAPTTASATITVSGTANEISGMAAAPAADVSLEARSVSADALLASAGPTLANGAFSLGPIPGVTPVDAYVKATKTGTRPTLVYPPQPLVANQGMVPVLMITDAQLGLLLQVLGGGSQDATKGLVGVAVLDCAGAQVMGATVAVKQNNVAVGNVVDIGAFSPGTFFVTNVPVGAALVTATFNGMTFRSHTVKSIAGTDTTTGVRPGF